MSHRRIFGGARRDRTDDLLRARQALSQLSYGPSTIIIRPFLGQMVGLGGFEPPTSPLSGVRSNQLSYRPKQTTIYNIFVNCILIDDFLDSATKIFTVLSP